MEYLVVIQPDSRGKVSKKAAQQRILQVLQRRAKGMGTAEPTVVAKDDDLIIVEIPGVKDASKTPAFLTSSARIEFYHAKNVISSQDLKRNYRPIYSQDANNPLVSFIRASDDKEIKPGTKEYKEMIDGWSLILSGTDVARAQANPKGTSYEPALEFSSDGTRKMMAWSNVYYGKEESIAVVLDGNVLSIANVHKEARLESNCVINGTFTADYVKSLVELVNGGSLPGGLKLLRSSVVSPAK